MKKKLLLFVSITFMLLTMPVGHSQTEYKLDSIQRYDWNANTSTFKLNNRDHYTYENGGTKETFYIWYLRTGNQWNPSIRYNKLYNEDNNVIEKVNETYDSALDVWNASTKDYYTYDSSQNVILIEDFTSPDGGVTWDIPRTEQEYAYNSDNLITEFTNRYYDPVTMTMINLGQITTTYNGLNKEEEITRFWSSSSNTWLNNLKVEYSYSGNLPIQKDFYSWLGSNWDSQPYLQILISYDGDLPTEEISQIWNSSGNFWENSFRTIRVYDTNENIEEVNTSDWDDNTSTWINSKQELWYWSEADILSVEEEDILGIEIYPNPATDYVGISNLSQKSKLVVFDILGKRIGDYTLEANQTNYINTHQFPNGLYFLKISSETGTISKKLLVR